jgi:predicted RNA binding protein YcfA (HicA-like mRNA interferase family)
MKYVHEDGRHTVVPRHDPIKEGTLRGILSDCHISREDFISRL